MKNNNKPLFCVIYGPTGVGKTDFALEIACHIPAEIINMDVGQFYTPLSIGTAKPDWKNSSIPHHLFDIIDKPVNYSISEYRMRAYKIAQEILNRGKLPIFVGGSGFYLHSLLFSSSHSLNHGVLSSFDRIFQGERMGKVDNLWHELNKIDPKRAANIAKTDIYRIQRALDIWYSTGILPSLYVPVYNPQADYIILWIERDRSELKKRINDRLMSMMEQGWIEESQKLCNTPWEPFLRKKNLIGYREIFDYIQSLHNQESFDLMIKHIADQTKQYAKRQSTFWRKLEREIKKEKQYTGSYIGCLEVIDVSNVNIPFYAHALSQRLSQRIKKE